MVMIQNTAPFQIALIFWDAEDLQIGKYKYAQALDIVKRCKASGSWKATHSKMYAGTPSNLRQHCITQKATR